MPTIKDVAERANVSVATVSRALNRRGYVSSDTYNRIMGVIRDMDYTPNPLMRSFLASASKVVALVLPTLHHPFFSEIAQKLEALLSQRGYHVLLYATEDHQDGGAHIGGMLHQGRMDGIVVASHLLDPSAYSDIGVPVVSFDSPGESMDVTIASNHALGGRLAAERVLSTRCRSVLQIIGNPEAHTNARVRHQVFFERMTGAGISCISVPVPSSMDLDITSYTAFVDGLLAQYPGVDTVFATDLFAMAIAKSALRHGRRIPDDLQIIGYDGSYLSSFTYPQITTICQPISKLAGCIADSLCALIEGRSVQPDIVLDDLTLLEGDTMRPPVR